MFILHTVPHVFSKVLTIVKQSSVTLIGDHFLYSHDLNLWFSGDIVERN